MRRTRTETARSRDASALVLDSCLQSRRESRRPTASDGLRASLALLGRANDRRLLNRSQDRPHEPRQIQKTVATRLSAVAAHEGIHAFEVARTASISWAMTILQSPSVHAEQH